ncbi:MAG: Iron-sulfur cluster assembly accessory protein [Armatimonadetes bacterium]|nr:Iron-sulfur cluster assembly accessory protein [Armatimonadota bacterium]
MFNVINKPTVNLTDAAIAKVKEILQSQEQADAGLRIYIAGGGCSGFKYGMTLDTESGPDDEVMDYGGLKVFVDSMSLPYLRGANVDYVDDALLGQGFKVDNPNAASTCGCGSSFKAAEGEEAPASGGGCGSGGCGSGCCGS